jgi:DNA-binding PadR family transcriptional regulator
MTNGQLDMLLLGVLCRGPQHGYAVISALRDLSEGGLELPEGSVYPALHKLEAEGLVASEWSTADGRKRRVYALTAPGRAALTKRKKEWALFARGVDAVLA